MVDDACEINRNSVQRSASVKQQAGAPAVKTKLFRSMKLPGLLMVIEEVVVGPKVATPPTQLGAFGDEVQFAPAVNAELVGFASQVPLTVVGMG